MHYNPEYSNSSGGNIVHGYCSTPTCDNNWSCKRTGLCADCFRDKLVNAVAECCGDNDDTVLDALFVALNGPNGDLVVERVLRYQDDARPSSLPAAINDVVQVLAKAGGK